MIRLFSLNIVATLLVFVLSIAANAQVPNDDCSTATVITHGAWPVYVPSTAENATPSMGDGKKDVWFQFTATNSSLFVRLSGSPMAYEVYSGTCGNLILVKSHTPTGGFCADLAQSAGLSVGQTYYVRVYFDSPQAFPFLICLLDNDVYDVCASARELTINNDMLIDSLVFASMMYARVSSIPPIDFPVSTTWGIDDVWFRFTATDTAHTVYLASEPYINCWTNNTFPYLYARYKGCTPADTIGTPVAGTSTFGVDTYIDFHSLTVGDTYYLRLWSNKSTGVSADFFAGVGSLGSVGQAPAPVSNVDARQKGLYIVPNPAISQIKLQLPPKNYTAGQVCIFDMTGQVQYRGFYRGGEAIDVSEFAAGVYFIRYSDTEEVVGARFIKQ